MIEIAIDQIVVSERLRDIDSESAQRIATSFRTTKQIVPIEVRQTPDGAYHLVVGAHRLEAARLNHSKTIRAIIFDGDEIDAKLREIDENLHRAELTPYDQATFLAARYNLWDALQRNEDWGGDRRSIQWRDQVSQPAKLEKNKLTKRFSAQTAQTLGVSEATIYRALKRRKDLAPYWADLRGTEASKTAASLDALTKLSPLRLSSFMERVRQGEDFSEALCAERPVRASTTQLAKSPKVILKEIRKLWAILPDAQREIFREEIQSPKTLEGAS